MFEEVGVNLKKIAASTTLPAVVRLLAMQILTRDNSYSSPGDWFKSLPAVDLRHLLMLTSLLANDNEETSTQEEKDALEVIVLLSVILAQAEGIPSTPDLFERASLMAKYLALESLSRQGAVEVLHENFTFGDDGGSNIIARAIKLDPPIQGLHNPPAEKPANNK